MRKLTLALAGVATMFCAPGLSAQEALANAIITIPTLLSISVDQLSVSFPQPSFADYDAGSVESTVTSVIDTQANVIHDVTIAADNATMTYSGSSPDPNKPSTDLQWSKDAGSTWTPLTMTETDVATAVPEGLQFGVASVTYRMLLDAAKDVPGTYELGFTFTVVAN